MESADDGVDLFFSADFPGVVQNVANAGMGTPGDDDQAFGAFINESGIVRQEIRLFFIVLDLDPNRLLIFKGVGSGYLPEKNQILRQCDDLMMICLPRKEELDGGDGNLGGA